MRNRWFIASFALAAVFFLALSVQLAEAAEIAILTKAPNVPPPITRTRPTTLKVNITTEEITATLDGDTKYEFWTFNGTVPGPMIRVRVGDTIELSVKNLAGSQMDHGIDLHAVTGPGGGMAVLLTEPGEEKILRFKALKPGTYIYHCAAPHIPTHIANGMYGLIVVEPEGGFSKVDKEYYLMQSEFYVDGKKGDKGLLGFSHKKALAENPDYVVFNGSVGAVTGAGALTAKVGDTVRLFVGNIGPNLISSFHVIGEIFDTVYTEGGSVANHDVQTTLVPAGGAAIVEFKVDYPGNYIIVDHSIFRAIDKGAVGILTVTGRKDSKIFNPIK